MIFDLYFRCENLQFNELGRNLTRESPPCTISFDDAGFAVALSPSERSGKPVVAPGPM